MFQTHITDFFGLRISDAFSCVSRENVENIGFNAYICTPIIRLSSDTSDRSRAAALDDAVRPLLQMALRACLHAPPLGGCLTLPTDVAAVAAFMMRVPTLASASSARGESGKTEAEEKAKGALPVIPFSTRLQDPISKISEYLINNELPIFLLAVSVPRVLTQVIKFCIEMVLTHVLHAIDAIRSGHLTNGSLEN
jgi:hypothetical protein